MNSTPEADLYHIHLKDIATEISALEPDAHIILLLGRYPQFINSPWHVGYQLLGKIFTDGNPFLPNQCLEVITVSVFFVCPPSF
ncbi:hypothetical protein P4O66_018381 [Electrophorus voltai]|uniref:Uncharacterized protein n=1 Tax=Electrophorus voltai TaxID=2609070 RepID=A0AAD9DKC2_9TELE|nr:hypothetical protein P4O66_018381 [Electrophorus voltai]